MIDPLCNFVIDLCGCSLAQNIAPINNKSVGGSVMQIMQAVAFHKLQN
jgi:hypothetical protein